MGMVSLRPNESVKRTVHRHPVMLLIPLAVAFGLLVLSFFLLFPLFRLGTVGVALFALLALFALAVAARSWILWRSTVLLITNQRAVDVDRTGLFRWTISDVLFDNMADIAYETDGPLQASFHAGDVTISTVSGSHAIRGTFLPDPGGVREAIVAELVAWRERKNRPEAARPPATPAERAAGRDAGRELRRREVGAFLDGKRG